MTSRLVQVTNVSNSVLKEQLRSLFAFLGRIEEIHVYPESETLASTVSAKVGYIKFERSESAQAALNLTSTIFLDRPIIVNLVKPSSSSSSAKIPDETDALKYCPSNYGNVNLIPGGTSWPHTIINRIVNLPGTGSNQSTSYIETVDPNLASRSLPPYPPLPGSMDQAKAEIIRRTVFVSNLDPRVSFDNLHDLFSQIGEIRYIRMTKSINDVEYENLGLESVVIPENVNPENDSVGAYIEFLEQPSIVKALCLNGLLFGQRHIKVNHATTSIIVPATNNEQIFIEDIKKAKKSSSSSSHKDSHRQTSSSRNASEKHKSSKSHKSRHGSASGSSEAEEEEEEEEESQNESESSESERSVSQSPPRKQRRSSRSRSESKSKTSSSRRSPAKSSKSSTKDREREREKEKEREREREKEREREREKEKEKIKKNYYSMLKEMKNLHRHSSWTETKKLIENDPRYKAVESSSKREDYFRDHCKYLDSKSSHNGESSKSHKHKDKDKERDESKDKSKVESSKSSSSSSKKESRKSDKDKETSKSSRDEPSKRSHSSGKSSKHSKEKSSSSRHHRSPSSKDKKSKDDVKSSHKESSSSRSHHHSSSHKSSSSSKTSAMPSSKARDYDQEERENETLMEVTESELNIENGTKKETNGNKKLDENNENENIDKKEGKAEGESSEDDDESSGSEESESGDDGSGDDNDKNNKMDTEDY